MPAYQRKFKLSNGEPLPRVALVQPGPRGSYHTHNSASGAVEVGDVVSPTNEAHASGQSTKGGRVQTVAGALGSANTDILFVADRPVDVTNLDPVDFGPVEVQNQSLANGEFVGTHAAGVIATPLVASAASYSPHEKLTWDGTQARPDGFTGTGAWKTAGAGDRVCGHVVEATELTQASGSALVGTGNWQLKIRLTL